MNWLVFALITFAALVLETGLRTLFALGPGVTPSFLLVIAVFIGLLAQPGVVVWSMLVLGVLTDIQGGPVAGGVIIGPAALGYLAGAYAVLQLRTLVFRESVFTLAVMTFVVGVFVQLVVVAMFTIRGLPIVPAEAIQGWSAAEQLVHRFLELLYSAVAAVPIGLVLFRFAGLWGFHHTPRSGRHY